LNTPGAGFGYDTNQVTILSKKGEKFVSELLPKKEIAKTIVTHIINHV
jgi:phosphopantothenoylcysteine decarboxylase/phosphopantothenate--cysteine ligase